MKSKSELERLTEAVCQAEAELDAATTRSALDTPAKRLMTARAALKRLQGGSGGEVRPARGVARNKRGNAGAAKWSGTEPRALVGSCWAM
jgi:hypothetical protein